MNERYVYVVRLGTGCWNNQPLAMVTSNTISVCQMGDIRISLFLTTWPCGLTHSSRTFIYFFAILVQLLWFSTKPTNKLTPQLPQGLVGSPCGGLEATEVWKQFDSNASWETTELSASSMNRRRCQGSPEPFVAWKIMTEPKNWITYSSIVMHPVHVHTGSIVEFAWNI